MGTDALASGSPERRKKVRNDEHRLAESRLVDRALVFSLVGLVSGTLGGAYFWHSTKEELRGGPLQELLVVTRDVGRGEQLAADALDVATVPESYVDSRRIPAREKEVVVGVPVTVALKAGESLYWTDLTGGETGRSHLAEVIPSGRRAYQLGPGANPFGSLVEVGDWVDVICTDANETHTVVERTLVLAVGDRLLRQAERPKSESNHGSGISLSVLPNEAEALLRIEKSCQLKVVLRNSDDIARQDSGHSIAIKSDGVE